MYTLKSDLFHTYQPTLIDKNELKALFLGGKQTEKTPGLYSVF